MFFEVLPHARDGFVPGKIAHERDDQVLALEPLYRPEVLFRREITLASAFQVGCRHQLRVGEIPVARPSERVRTGEAKRIQNGCYSRFIRFAELKLVSA